MIRYERFQESVLQQAGSLAETWLHILPSVPLAHRVRFLHTVRQGFTIPESFDIVMLSLKLMDKEYERFLQQAQAAKLTRQDPGEFIEKFTVED